MILGITGGTGCGKTTLLQCVRERGGLLLDCDEIYHGLLRTDEKMLSDIAGRFPGTVADGSLDRKALGAIVFADENALLQLNAITHAAVKREVERRLSGFDGLAAIDAIGLVEGGLVPLCHTTVAVTAPLEQRIRRLMARDGITREYALSRIHAQKDEAFYRENCDHTLCNDGTLEQFREKCRAFLTAILD